MDGKKNSVTILINKTGIIVKVLGFLKCTLYVLKSEINLDLIQIERLLFT